MNIVQIIKLNKQITEQLIILRNESLNYIKRTLGVDGVAVFDNEDDELCVVYDGGNHPEYAAYPYATVKSIYSEGGNIYLNLEEDDRYYIDNICEHQSFFNIAYHLYAHSFMKGRKVILDVECMSDKPDVYIIDSVDLNGIVKMHNVANPEVTRITDTSFLYIVD